MNYKLISIYLNITAFFIHNGVVPKKAGCKGNKDFHTKVKFSKKSCTFVELF